MKKSGKPAKQAFTKDVDSCKWEPYVEWEPTRQDLRDLRALRVALWSQLEKAPRGRQEQVAEEFIRQHSFAVRWRRLG